MRRLGETPVAVFAADWHLLWWNDAWASLLGDPLWSHRRPVVLSVYVFRSRRTTSAPPPGR
nr:hypothetical protein [Streptomyces parvulus]